MRELTSAFSRMVQISRMVSKQGKIAGISAEEAGMKYTGSRMKLETKFLLVFCTLPDYRGFLLGVSGCAV